MLPGPFDETVIERQRRHIEAQIGGPLYVGVAAEDVRARAWLADIARGETQDAERTDVGGAHRVLGRAHAPDQGGGLLLGELLGHAAQLLARHAGNTLDLLGIPLGDFLADVVHGVDALADELLVLPAILEHVPEDAPDHRDVGAGTDADIFRGVGGRAGEARIDDDHVRAVDLLAGQQVLKGDRMRFGGVSAENDHRLGVADVVVGIGLSAVAPGIGNACHRGRMADPRLVIDRVGTPEGAELTQDVGGLVGEFGRAEPVDGIRAVFVPQAGDLVADLIDGLIPGDAGPLPVDHLHRIFQAAVAGDELADRRALGAMGTPVDRAAEGGLLADPDAVHDLRRYRATHRAMGTDVLLDRHLGADRGGARRLGLADRAELDRAGGREPSGDEARNCAGRRDGRGPSASRRW